MNELLFFVLGLLIGGLTGMTLMCILQINRIDELQKQDKKKNTLIQHPYPEQEGKRNCHIKNSKKSKSCLFCSYFSKWNNICKHLYQAGKNAEKLHILHQVKPKHQIISCRKNISHNAYRLFIDSYHLIKFKHSDCRNKHG